MSQPSDGFRVKCKCGVILKVKTAGIVIACPKCGNKMKVPAAGSAAGPASQTTAKVPAKSLAQVKKPGTVPNVADDTDSTEGISKSTRKAPAKKGGSKKLILIVSSAVVLIAALAGGAFFFLTGDSSKSANNKPLAQNTKDGENKNNPKDAKDETKQPKDDTGAKGAPMGKGDGKGKEEAKGKEETKGSEETKGPSSGSGAIGKYLLPEFFAAVTIQPGKILKNPLLAKYIPPGALEEAGKDLGIGPEDVDKVYVLLDFSVLQGAAFGPPPGGLEPKGKGGFPDKSNQKEKGLPKDKNEFKDKDDPLGKGEKGKGGSPFGKGPPGFPGGPGLSPAAGLASGAQGMVILVTTKKPIPVANLEKLAPPEIVTKADHKGKAIYVAKELPGAPPIPGASYALAFPEPNLVLGGSEKLVRKILDGGMGNPALAARLEKAGGAEVQLLVVFEKIRPTLGLLAAITANDVPPEFKDVPKLLASLDTLSLDADLSGKDLLKLEIGMTDAESVKTLEGLVKMGLDAGLNQLKEMKPLLEGFVPPEGKPFALPLLKQLEKGLDVKVMDKTLTITLPRPEKFGE